MYCDRIAWRFHIEINKDQVFRTFIKVYFLFNTQQLCTNIKWTLQKVFISYVMTYTHPTHVFAADIHLLKLLHLQNKTVCSIGSFHGAHQLSAILAISMVHTNPCDMILLQNDVPGIQMKCEIGKENIYSWTPYKNLNFAIQKLKSKSHITVS